VHTSITEHNNHRKLFVAYDRESVKSLDSSVCSSVLQSIQSNFNLSPFAYNLILESYWTSALPLMVSENTNNNGDAEEGMASETGNPVSESTSLLSFTTAAMDYGDLIVSPTPPLESTDSPKTRVSGQSFFYHRNPTVQRYYRFTASNLTPMIALHKRPITNHPPTTNGSSAHGENNFMNNTSSSSAGVTGLLRRSGVVPSHGTDPTGEWILVSVGGRSGWARRKIGGARSNGHPNSLTTPMFSPVTTFRAYEAWMSNHSFYWNGLFMLGSDAPSVFLSTALIVFGTIIQCCFIVPQIHDPAPDQTYALWTMASNYSFTIFCWTIGLALLSLVTLWRAATMDPGIIPPMSSPIKALPPLLYPNTSDTKTVVPIGGITGHRYCSTCNIFRPPRSKHCNSCNVCVRVFDHHCPWVGNCIGERNYAVFVVFLVAVTLLTTLISFTSIVILIHAFQKERTWHLQHHQHSTPPPTIADIEDVDAAATAVLESVLSWEDTWSCVWKVACHMPVILMFAIFSGMCAWSMLSLLLYHFRTISIAQTTNERIRGVYSAVAPIRSRDSFSSLGNMVSSNSSNSNPADLGVCRNWYSCCHTLWCPPHSDLPSDFSELVVEPNIQSETIWSGVDSESRQSGTTPSSATTDAYIDVKKSQHHD
jgi:DHHC palmitoyltransferase